MKKTLYTLLAFAISLVAVSCSDFLKEEPKGQLLSNLAFTEKTDLEGALQVLRYKVSRAAFGTTEFEQAYMGDDLATHPKSNKAAMREWDRMEISNGNERLQWYWAEKYLVIKAANFIIDGAESAPNSAEEITNAINTAKFWRAWAFFNLVRAFGAVPLVITNDIDYGIGLTSVAGVYDQIVKDLTDACNLPKSTPYGLIKDVSTSINQDPNSGAAHAMLACVYLNMAGWPLNKGEAYYKLAAQEAEAVINGGYYYKLYDDYRDIHSAKCNLNNTEAVLSIYGSDDAGDGDASLMFRGCIMDFPDCSDAWCDTRAELKFYADYPDGYRKSIVYPKTFVVATGQLHNFWDEKVPTDNQFPYFGEKAWTIEANNPATPVEYDWTKSRKANNGDGWDTQAHMVIRYSEVLCWAAEGLARSGGDLGKAAGYLNQVRNRAEGPGKKIDKYSASDGAANLAEAAYNEHRWEIAGWWAGAIQNCFNDLARLKRAEAHYNYRKAATPVTVAPGVQLAEPYGPTEAWSDAKMFAPYPAMERVRNHNLDVDIDVKITDEFINGTEVIYPAK